MTQEPEMPYDVHGEQIVGDTLKETKDIANLWNAWCHEVTQGNAVMGIDPPPALFNLYNVLLTSNYPLEPILELAPDLDKDGKWEAAFQNASTLVLAFAETMFKFAQFCSARGLLHANLTQCQCGTASDEALQKWVEGGNGA